MEKALQHWKNAVGTAEAEADAVREKLMLIESALAKGTPFLKLMEELEQLKEVAEGLKVKLEETYKELNHSELELMKKQHRVEFMWDAISQEPDHESNDAVPT